MTVAALLLCSVLGLRQAPVPSPATAPPPAASAAVDPHRPEAGPKEVFPHVRVDAAAKVVEFDAKVSGGPLVYLEVVACTPDTREHEALVVSEAKPSHVHAALLLIGLRPGAPASWKFENDALTPVAPTGDRVDVRFVYTGAAGERVEADPRSWIANAEGTRTLAESQPEEGWLFAGSRLVKRPAPPPTDTPPPTDQEPAREPASPAAATGPQSAEMYDADGSGTLLGLHAFCSETIAWSKPMSPDASVEEPQWVAKPDAIPDPGTAVTVRLTPGRK